MNTYLVALQTGGIMEQPYFEYIKYDVIQARSREEAQDKYNTKYNCDYYYGVCMAELVDNQVNVFVNDVPLEKLELLNKKLKK